jgi:serine/threonine protein kinase
MLSGGHCPIEGSNVQNVWQRKLTEDPAPLRPYRSDLPDDLDALVMQCLARDAARRPASADDLKRLLLAALEEARTISSTLAALRVPSSTALVPDLNRHNGSLWWKTLAVATATAVVGWIAARPFFVHRPTRPQAVLTQPAPTTPAAAAGATR